MSVPDPVDVFLERFANALRGRECWRDETVAEIRAHLLDVLDDDPEAFVANGRIVERFGDPHRLAATLSLQHALRGLRLGATHAARFIALATAATFAAIALGIDIVAEGQERPASVRVFALRVGSGEDVVGVAGLAEAVRRWTLEAPETGPGEPLLAKTASLLAPAGTSDRLRAFPTSRGRVCFEVLGAGTCGQLSASMPISVAILSTRAGGTRVFGVAADEVSRVQVDVGGALRDATLETNGFYYRLADAATSADVRRVITTTSDGRHHILPVHS